MQPSSQADAHRLNLEYTEAIVEYILNEIRKPGLSDEVVDLKKLGLRKQSKNVNFDSEPAIIPSPETFPEESGESVSGEGGDGEGSEGEGGEGETNGSEEHSSDRSSGSDTSDSSTRFPKEVTSPRLPAHVFPPATPTNNDVGADEEDDDIETDSGSHGGDEADNSLGVVDEGRGRHGTIVGIKPADGEKQEVPERPTESAQNQFGAKESKRTLFESTFEVAKVLFDHLPLEVLRRLVLWWPVEGEDEIMTQNSLSRQRLLMSVWDCSGDPLQLAVVPLFFSRRCVYIVTHNSSKCLDHPADSYLTHKLTTLQGSVPTHADVLEEWIGSVMVQAVHQEAGPYSYQDNCPQLPPMIFVTPHSDEGDSRSFIDFFQRPSFESYAPHVLERQQNYVAVSNSRESEMEEEYTGHHFLRREIDHIARQMPYVYDMIPVHWVKFEQLLYTLQEQKKVVIQLPDLERYIGDLCEIVGPLQVEPLLAHFNDIGMIIHFHRHPALAKFIIIKPQWLLNALASIFTSSSNTWITTQVRSSFQKLLQMGVIRTEVLLLAYRCARLSQRYWNETLYFMNYMDLVACHPALHGNKSVFIPAMVTQSPPTFSFGPTATDPATLYFKCNMTTFPVTMFNQLVVRCIRNSAYAPSLYHDIVHLRLNSSHHLLLRREGQSLGVLVQSNTAHFCPNCQTETTRYHVTTDCSHVKHIADYESDSTSTEYQSIYTDIEERLPMYTTLLVTDDVEALDRICPQVLAHLQEQLKFLTSCWHPGLRLTLTNDRGQPLDSKWRVRELGRGLVDEKLSVWFTGIV